MARISLKQAINESFIQRFRGVAKQKSSGDNLAGALNGNNSEISVSQGLRQGARTYANAIQGLNAIGSVVNVARSNLTRLSELTSELMDVTERATRSTTGEQERRKLDREFRTLGKEFKAIIKEAKNGDRDVLAKEDLQEFFLLVGLDSTESESVADFFGSLVFGGEDELLASEETKADLPLDLPASAYKKTISVPDGMGGRIEKEIRQSFSPATEKLFDSDNSIAERVDAFRTLEDLEALKDQIDGNLEALEEGGNFLLEVSDLVRTTGLAMLELSDRVTSIGDAAQVAKDLRNMIRKDAPTALRHAELLDPIAAAALLLDEDSFA